MQKWWGQGPCRCFEKCGSFLYICIIDIRFKTLWFRSFFFFNIFILIVSSSSAFDDGINLRRIYDAHILTTTTTTPSSSLMDSKCCWGVEGKWREEPVGDALILIPSPINIRRLLLQLIDSRRRVSFINTPGMIVELQLLSGQLDSSRDSFSSFKLIDVVKNEY